jgi:peptidoglycan hydrolase-like protein with peptidoglycan-binding domain
MARSARRPERTAARKRNALGVGTLALGSLIAANPVLVGGSTAFLVTLFYVSANALWYQPFPHSGAFFATRNIERVETGTPDEPETTINIVRPETPRPSLTPPRSDRVVQQVQGILKDLGFYTGTVDGLPGPNTQRAIDAYRQKVGLAKGGMDQELLDQLGVSPSTGAVPQPRPRMDAAASAPAAESAAPAQSEDARILRIQAGLKAFGNDDMKLDGVVGARTRAAIKEFQSLFGLPETGEPDEAVYAKMREIGLTN